MVGSPISAPAMSGSCGTICSPNWNGPPSMANFSLVSSTTPTSESNWSKLALTTRSSVAAPAGLDVIRRRSDDNVSIPAQALGGDVRDGGGDAAAQAVAAAIVERLRG